MQRRMPASIARSNAGMPEERVIVTAVTLPSEVCNFTWYSAVGFSAPLREASDKPRPAARRHGLWRHSPRRGRRIRRSGCGRRCRRMPAAPSASLRKASLRALSAAAFWRPLPGLLLGGGLLGGDLFSRGLFGGRLLGSSLSAAAFLAASSLAFFSAATFRLRPFPQRPCRRQPCQRPGVPVPGASFPSARPACALPPGAPFPWRPRRLRAPFLFLTLLLGLLQRDLRVDFRLGRLDLGFGRRRGGSGCFCGSGSGCGLG